ncbi:hypothetical protein [Halochromatium roseum]|uniref:hypothetical protein n=1 Tax=Halochromatium roseum TaxID=391920 RepID=UPI0019131709|nr:hypothetical protein [Halochromatium roseum]MBK5941094.1 hypothetical protein [Halochromatium roseum]
MDSHIGAKLNQAAERFSTLLHTKPASDVSTDSAQIIERPPIDRRPAATKPARSSDDTDADILGEGGKSSGHDEPPGPIITPLTGPLIGRQPTDARSTPVSASDRPIHGPADAKSDRLSTDGQPVRPPSAFIIGESGPEPAQPTSAPPGQQHTKPNESSSSGSDFPTGDRILQGLGQQRATVENPSAPETSTTQTSDQVEQIERLGERLAQRILVTDRGEVGDSEVRIQLRESVLQGGEIRLRQEHGQLLVSIQLPSTDLARQLSGQVDSLQQALANRLETPVRVEVQVIDALNAGHDAGHDSNPGDGRSRNRRDPWDADEDQGA